jgi:hypothetical protein
MPVFGKFNMSTSGSRPGRVGYRWLVGFGGAVSLALVAMACGGDSNPNSPTPPPGGSSGVGGPTVQSLSLTITSGGLSAPTADLAVGGTVTITNSDSRSHDMDSDPHPVHTDCPALNLGPIGPGTSRTSSAQNSARACGMHDHDNPGTQSLMRTIVIR